MWFNSASSPKKKGFKINCLVDNNKHKWGKVILGDKIVSPKEIKFSNNKIPIIIAVDLNFPYIRKQLNEMGLTNVYDSDFVFSELNLDKILFKHNLVRVKT